MGKLLAICTSPQRGTVKTEVESARLTPEWGIETDAHGGNWHRQVSLLSAEKIENFRKKIWAHPSDSGQHFSSGKTQSPCGVRDQLLFLCLNVLRICQYLIEFTI